MFPVLTLITLIIVGLLPLWPPALLLLLVSTIASIALRARLAAWLFVVSGPFRQISALLSAAHTIAGGVPTDRSSLTQSLGADARTLARLGRIAALSRRDTGSPEIGRAHV